MKIRGKSENMKKAKVNAKATILEGSCKGVIGTVVSADVYKDKVFVKIRTDEYTLIETTTDNIHQD